MLAVVLRRLRRLLWGECPRLEPLAPLSSLSPCAGRLCRTLGATKPGSVVLDGVDIANAVTKITIDARDRETEAVVRFGQILDIETDAMIRVDDRTRAALLALGWTPPNPYAYVYTDEDGIQTFFNPETITVTYQAGKVDDRTQVALSTSGWTRPTDTEGTAP